RRPAAADGFVSLVGGVQGDGGLHGPLPRLRPVQRDAGPAAKPKLRVLRHREGLGATAQAPPIDDAKPMLILAPMHPVMLVYALDQTAGKEVPKQLLEFAHFEGEWQPKWLANLVENAGRHRIGV